MTSVEDLRGWAFETELPGGLAYEGAVTDRIKLATPGEEAGVERKEELVLEIKVTAGNGGKTSE